MKTSPVKASQAQAKPRRRAQRVTATHPPPPYHINPRLPAHSGSTHARHETRRATSHACTHARARRSPFPPPSTQEAAQEEAAQEAAQEPRPQPVIASLTAAPAPASPAAEWITQEEAAQEAAQEPRPQPVIASLTAAPTPASPAVEWITRTAAAVRSGNPPQERLALLEIFGGAPRRWSMTGAVNMLALQHGMPVRAYSLDAGFEPTENVLDESLLADIGVVIDAALVGVLWLAIPCESRSIMWTQYAEHPFLSRREPDGRADMPPSWRRYARMHNTLIATACALAGRQRVRGGTYYIENPVDVGLPSSPYYQHSKRHHVSLWISSPFRALAAETSPHYATTEMCAWLGRFHKPTTIAGSGPGSSHYLYLVGEVKCRTASHILRATDLKPDGSPYSPEAGEYPQLFCAYAAATWLEPWLAEQLPRPKLMVRSSQRVLAFLARFISSPPEPTEAHTQQSGPPADAPSRTGSLEEWREYSNLSAEEAARASVSYPPLGANLADWRSAHTSLPAHWDESSDVVASKVAEARAHPLQFISRRRAEPELLSNLAERHFPCPTVAVQTEAAPAYAAVAPAPDWPPQPIAAHQLWRDGIYAEILAAVAAVQAACAVGAAGGIMPKLEPRVFAVELMQPWARRHIEEGGAFDNADPLNVVPLQPYSADDPVPQRTDSARADFFVQWSNLLRWPDADMVQQVAITGVEARSRCTHACIVMGHHGGLRRNFSHAADAIEQDTLAGFVSRGRAHPWTFPFIAVARNCVERHQWKLRGGKLCEVVKWRVTTDDSISVDSEVSRNDGIDASAWARAGLPAPQTLAEAVAIVKAACSRMGIAASEIVFERIALWILDLTGAYRVLAVQRREWGQQSYVWSDGIRLDLRCLFGTASMVEFFERVTFFVLTIAQRRIAEYDRQHPYSPARQAWSEWRERHVAGPTDPLATPAPEACTASYIYLDDGFGMLPLGQHEQLRGRPDFAIRPLIISLHVEPSPFGGARIGVELFVGLSRPQTHLHITSSTFARAGWEIAQEKVELDFAIDELGLRCSSSGDGCLTVPEAKRQGMLVDIRRQQPPPTGSLQPGQRVHREHAEQLVGRCGHIAQVAPEANVYMTPLYRMLNAPIKYKTSGGRLMRQLPPHINVTNGSQAAQGYQAALSWWAHALEAGVSVPLAPRLEFPDLDAPGVAFMFTDAAREAATGHGGFTLIRTSSELVFLYTDPRWPPDVLEALQSNTLSMPAGEGIGAVVFADAMAATLPGLRHITIFTDSSPVVAALQSGNSESPQLNAIVQWLFQRRPRLQLIALHQPGKRNGAADGLSRHATTSVVADAVAAGARPERIDCIHAMSALARAAMLVPQRR